jgi:thiol-disulfide isomerase/thioredoxin
MFNPQAIAIQDIQTPVLQWAEYIDTVKDLQFREPYEASYRAYVPKSAIINEIKLWLAKTNESIQIIAFGAKWCPDCQVQMPRLAKIAESVNDPRFSIGLIGGIMTKIPTQRKAGEPIWKSPPSPTESVDIRFDMGHIPILYIFGKSGKCIGRIVERPKKSTIEDDILDILRQ